MLSVLEVSELLNVSSRRIRALIADGRIPAQLIGKTWAIRHEDIADLPQNRPAGRPLSTANALLELSSGASTPPDIATMSARYRQRAVSSRFNVLELNETMHDSQLRVGGWDAAAYFDSKSLPRKLDDPVIAYITEEDRNAWIAEHRATPSPTGNFVLLSMPRIEFNKFFSYSLFVVPPKFAAVDIAEYGGERAHSATKRLWKMKGLAPQSPSRHTLETMDRTPEQQRIFSMRNKILNIALNYRFTNVAIFGSVARGDNNANSDIDLLVDALPGAHLGSFPDCMEELSAILGKSVDIVDRRGLKTTDTSILSEQIFI
jgi:excisionase family DNA binding protein